ncbi:hypothetical protein SERLA73DRAFT_189944 [Serpula lacrymans var. lacrymans S7.3]|uniref:F-box domain-containing protein n=2 Tax=Serpula lacrymans var. lacrymans TaxID=341189 RepID=F8QEU2_SERL3|nr:uncharacterized protein SERLADRAFT_444574 [Serpula lacrymans var. lacrymans S7.9]EGN93105.1 hypothetical protein SERLA73DRAFT_189944 [Serpula lacrymans var. lacrymans S7.3]EGO31000.1 hypothetical protein SERLADRAFT_444574 [Serpula lacrymans var. lacrymans S7.9]
MSNPDASIGLLDMPPETLLHILSYLDIPDLACLSRTCSSLACLAVDPVLHSNRLRVVAPSRVSHLLFGRSPQGIPFRPTVGDLVQRYVLRGLNIERRWRMGSYLHSAHSVKQYEMGLHLQRRRASLIVSSQLRRRASVSHALKDLHTLHVLPDIESSSLSVSRSLLPIMHQLKWCMDRDRLAKKVRDGACGAFGTGVSGGFVSGLGAWLELRGRGIVQDNERVRLILCPDVRKMVGFYESLG